MGGFSFNTRLGGAFEMDSVTASMCIDLSNFFKETTRRDSGIDACVFRGDTLFLFSGAARGRRW